MGGVIFALQALDAVHAGVDNLNAVGHVGRTAVDVEPVRPFELMNDGDLLALVGRLVARKGNGDS